MGADNLHIGAFGGGGNRLAARRQQRCRRTRRLVLVPLLVLVTAAIATDAAYPALRQTHALTHRRNSAEAELHPKRSKVARQSDRMARPDPSNERPTVSLPPDLAAAKQAIELIRKGEWKDATALAATVKDPVARKIVE